MRIAPETQRSNTSHDILDQAEMLIQSRGYSAFSYHDIAVALDIRKASIHYHYPSKTDLGIAVVERYAKRFGEGLAAIGADENQSSMRMLEHYMEPYREIAETPDRVCLCGALAGEIMVLPEPLRERVERFFKEHHVWLAEILKRGVERGEWKLDGRPLQMARLIFGALQGSLLVKRTTGDPAQSRDVMAMLKARLDARTPTAPEAVPTSIRTQSR